MNSRLVAVAVAVVLVGAVGVVALSGDGSQGDAGLDTSPGADEPTATAVEPPVETETPATAEMPTREPEPETETQEEAEPSDRTEAGAGLRIFEDAAAFREYARTGEMYDTGGGVGGFAAGGAKTGFGDGADGGDSSDGGGGDGQSTDRRVGTTNTQVAGVDEPDVVKTDGEHFFYAPMAPEGPPWRSLGG